MDALYLREDVQIEPLVDNWYAWAQLIPPATAARNMTERHLPIMESYIAAPLDHARAANDPKLRGGPFIGYPEDRVGDIKALRDRTLRDRARMIELSTALSELDSLLGSLATGYSLESLYGRVPVPLKGYVELSYDAANIASFRIVEPLIYRSPYYDVSAQSVMLTVTAGDQRPFVLSTPRLPAPNHLHLQIPFADERLDSLFALKAAPRPWSAIREMVPFHRDSESLLRSFFDAKAPRPCCPYRGDGLRWRYFGHACVLVETAGVSLLFDPMISYEYESAHPRFTYADLPPVIDYVLITHNHADHLLFETLLQLRHKVRNIIVPRGGGGALHDPSMALLLKQCGFKQVVELDELGVIHDGAVEITGVPFFGEHGDLMVSTKIAYLVRAGKASFLFAADSCNLEPQMYRHIRKVCGDVRILFLGMECDGAPASWMYGPLILRNMPWDMDQSRRLAGSNYEQAIALVDAFGFTDVYVYAMGQEPWVQYVSSIKYTETSRPIVESDRLLSACRTRGITCERLFGEKEVQLTM